MQFDCQIGVKFGLICYLAKLHPTGLPNPCITKLYIYSSDQSVIILYLVSVTFMITKFLHYQIVHLFISAKCGNFAFSGFFTELNFTSWLTQIFHTFVCDHQTKLQSLFQPSFLYFAIKPNRTSMSGPTKLSVVCKYMF